LGVFFWSMSINGPTIDVWDRFMRGYNAHRALPSADLSLIRAFAGVRVIWLMGLWCANAHLFGYHKLHDDYFDREISHLSDFHQEAMRSGESGC
jgi:Ser/Thr protein kinase RdoA (MazF antagonist)